MSFKECGCSADFEFADFDSEEAMESFRETLVMKLATVAYGDYFHRGGKFGFTMQVSCPVFSMDGSFQLKANCLLKNIAKLKLANKAKISGVCLQDNKGKSAS